MSRLESAPAGPPPPPVTAYLTGLTEAEAERRRADGRGNDAAVRTSRPVRDILRTNVFTRFNALLGGLLVVILMVGPLQDALFGFVLILNTAIGVAQELRARRTLDRLALVRAPHARVVRDGAVRPVPVTAVVEGDLVELAPGDQVVVDGPVVAGVVEVDESLLTGESLPVSKAEGDSLLSGSFAVSGTARYRAERVGSSAYAASLATEARRFGLVRSELRDGTNRILQVVTWVIPPAAGMLIWSQLRTEDLADAVRGAVAGVGAMVPEGLVLLTSLAMAVAVVRLAARRVLVQELGAVEGLARVDVVCLDKTGTLTDGSIEVDTVESLTDGVDSGAALGGLAAADPHPNASLRAVAAAFPAQEGWQVETTVPFSSARKWAAATFSGHGTWVLGAPEVLLSGGGAAARRVGEIAAEGRRVLLLARAATADAEGGLGGVEPKALVVLREGIRPAAPDTIAYFGHQGVALKVISGDHPATVAAISAAVGVPGAGAAGGADARDLPRDPDELGEALETVSVIGRITPDQKRAVVQALQRRGHVVAMTGDGVNDVLALKEADIGVAMGSGTDATRAVAPVVLLDDDFASLPGVVAEGRRVIANIERVANLFVTKTVYALLLAVVVASARLPYPFFPRNLTVVSSLAIGTPAFFLALAPNLRRARTGFLRRVAIFTVPTGTVAAAAALTTYLVARHQSGVTAQGVRTATMLSLLGVSLWVLVVLSRPLSPLRGLLVGAMAAGCTILFAWPWAERLLALTPPAGPVLWWTVGTALVGAALVEGVWRTVRGRAFGQA